MQAPVHCWLKRIANGGCYVEKLFCIGICKEFALLNSIIMLFVSVAISMEICGRHYFQINLRRIFFFSFLLKKNVLNFPLMPICSIFLSLIHSNLYEILMNSSLQDTET